MSRYAYFTPKLFEMCLKGCCGLVCTFRWKKKRILKVLVLVKIWSFFKKNTKKGKFSLLFFLTPPFFRPETDKLPKKSHRPSQMTKMLAKKIFMTFWSELVAEIQNVRPPPIGPIGVVFEINTYFNFLRGMTTMLTKSKISICFLFVCGGGNSNGNLPSIILALFMTRD